MREGLHFYYDGKYSEDMGLYNVNIKSNDLLEEPFLAEREINEVQVRGRDKPYFLSLKHLPLSFTLCFAFKDNYDEQKIREVARWLNQDYYKPFYTTDNPSRIFYCMVNSSSQLLHNGLKQGYVEIDMRCDSAYSYSPIYVSTQYELADYPKVIIETTQEDFNQGVLDGLIATPEGSLKLGQPRTKWSDIDLSTLWGDV